MKERVEAETGHVEPIARVAQYDVLRGIGQGGMAHVYLGRHQLLGRLAAIKILHPDQAGDPKMRQRFLNEARAVSAISHPNVVTLYELGQTPRGDTYLVMEYLAGETLGQRIKGRRVLELREALEVSRQVASALLAAHQVGVIHRDLKPSNVMLVPGEDGQEESAKVLDFGIAKLWEDGGEDDGLTRTGAVVGTPAFMSPEQCRGTGEIDHRSDIYSLGVLMYRLVTGRCPFESRGAGEIIGMHLYMPPMAPAAHGARIPAAFEQLILRCLEKEPRDRFADMQALIEGLEAIIATLGTRGSSIELPLMAPREEAEILPSSRAETGDASGDYLGHAGAKAGEWEPVLEPSTPAPRSAWPRRVLLLGAMSALGLTLGYFLSRPPAAAAPAAAIPANVSPAPVAPIAAPPSASTPTAAAPAIAPEARKPEATVAVAPAERSKLTHQTSQDNPASEIADSDDTPKDGVSVGTEDSDGGDPSETAKPSEREAKAASRPEPARSRRRPRARRSARPERPRPAAKTDTYDFEKPVF